MCDHNPNFEYRRPHCVRLVHALPFHSFLSTGRVGTWNSSTFVFSTDVSVDWETLKKYPDSWESLGYDTDGDGLCGFCAAMHQFKKVLTR